MKEKLVSIIIPTFNGEKFIEETIKNCQEQSYRNIEIIVINDGSSSKELEEVLEPYIKAKVIKYIYQENKGLAGARNTGIKHALGDYIQFLDDDDLLDKYKIENQVKYLEKNQEVLGVYCKTKYFDNDTKEIIKELEVRPNEDIYGQFLIKNFLSVNSILIRKKDLLFDESLKSLEDYDYWLRYFNTNEKIGFTDDTYCMVRVHNNNMSSNLYRMAENEIKVLEKELLKNSNSKYTELINYRLFKLKYLIGVESDENQRFIINANKYNLIKVLLYKFKQVIKKIKSDKKNIYYNKKNR